MKSLPAGSSPAHYHFDTRWRLAGSREEALAILRRADQYPRWWPTFLDATTLQRGEGSDTGTQVAVHTKGWLPYTLRFTFEILEAVPSGGFTIQVRGDFEGLCRLRVVESESDLEMSFDWECHMVRPLLRHGSRFFRFLGASNHRWTMWRGCRSLQREMNRLESDRASSLT